MDNSKSVEKCLSGLDVHTQWQNAYRVPENDRFYEEAFDAVINFLRPPKSTIVLDVGCGTCAHSIRLARRGFDVCAIDFSPAILKSAEENIKRHGLQDKIELQRQNLLSLSFQDRSFGLILCWGVLMHTPNLEKAVSELARVLKPGGFLVISEGNMHSLQSIFIRNIKQLLGKEKADLKRTPAGIEYWVSGSSGMLLTRQTNIKWLIEAFRCTGLTLTRRMPGQFTEVYSMVSSPRLGALFHGINHFWFKHVRLASPAFGNILVFGKKDEIAFRDKKCRALVPSLTG